MFSGWYDIQSQYVIMYPSEKRIKMYMKLSNTDIDCEISKCSVKETVKQKWVPDQLTIRGIGKLRCSKWRIIKEDNDLINTFGGMKA